MWSAAGMANVLSEDKRQQVLGLGRLGCSLRRIESATGLRRETAGGYLRAAGIAVRGRGGSPSAWPPKPAIEGEVSTGLSSGKSADLNSNPAIKGGATDLLASRSPTASACEPYRELILEALARGWNARAIWQDLVDDHSFGYAIVTMKKTRSMSIPTIAAANMAATMLPASFQMADRASDAGRRIVAVHAVGVEGVSYLRLRGLPLAGGRVDIDARFNAGRAPVIAVSGLPPDWTRRTE